MARAYSSGAPLPPNGGGAPYPLPHPVRLSLLAPFLPIRLAVRGGGSDDREFPLPSPPLLQALRKDCALLIRVTPTPLLVRGSLPPPSPAVRARGSRVAYQGVPSPPLPGQGVLPLPLLQAVRWERVLLLMGCPPLLRPLAARWGSPLSSQGAPLCPLSARRKRALPCGGSLPLLQYPLAMSWGRGLPGRGNPLYPLAVRRKLALLCGGSTPLLHILDMLWGSAQPGQGVPLQPLAAHRKSVLLGGGSPSYPPW